jgi:predicted amidophosphoribosyltransferase
MKEILAICAKCGFVSVVEKEKFCPNCGSKLLRECPNCGAHIKYPMAQYCPVCGMMYEQAERKRA